MLGSIISVRSHYPRLPKKRAEAQSIWVPIFIYHHCNCSHDELPSSCPSVRRLRMYIYLKPSQSTIETEPPGHVVCCSCDSATSSDGYLAFRQTAESLSFLRVVTPPPPSGCSPGGRTQVFSSRRDGSLGGEVLALSRAAGRLFSSCLSYWKWLIGQGTGCLNDLGQSEWRGMREL